MTDNWFQSLNQLGIPTIFDPNEGLEAGAYFLPSSIDPINQTRSDARRAYFDPYSNRSNLHVLVGSQVTQVLFNASEPNPQASTPVPGGFQNGTGRFPAPSNPYGPKPNVSQTSKAKRQAANNFHATGVEVSCKLFC